MASSQTRTMRPPRHLRGQGAVEAIVALPVFLALVCISFQLFFLGIAQVQLRYAAFCAARVGAVRDADIKEMEAAAGKVLSQMPGYVPVSTGSYRVEKIDPPNEKDGNIETAPLRSPELLKIRVQWDYPLFVPFMDTLLTGIISDRSLRKPAAVTLQASWTTIKYRQTPEKTDGKKQSRK